MFKGYDVWSEEICLTSTYKGKYKKPCIKTDCRHHVSNVISSQSGTEYSIAKLFDSEHCLLGGLAHE